METMSYENTAPVVTLELEGPRPQKRWTVALRVILAIPHWIWWTIIGIGVNFAVFAAWFAALAMGRMPDGLGTFLSRATQYYGRVTAYGQLLLTDEYPSFALDEPDYPVSVRVPWGGRLNRAAVFFRLVLLVPAALAYWIIGMGLSVCLVFIWLIVLIAGRVPNALFEALSAVLRYQLRLTAYAMMLTSEYPRGLFGDRGLASDVDAPLPMAPSAEAANVDAPLPMAPSAEAAVPPTPTSSAWPTASEWPAGGAAVSAPVGPPRITTLVLSKAAKRILVLFIAVGVVFLVAMFALSAIAADQAGEARSELTVLYQDISVSSQEYGSAVQGCAIRQAGIDCLQDAAVEFRNAMARFGNGLQDIELPPAALGAATQVDDEVADVISVLERMSQTSDPAEYQRIAGEFQQEAQQFDDSVLELDQVLSMTF